MSDTGIVWESVMFRGRFVEVSFTEERDRSQRVSKVTTFLIDEDSCPTELAELRTALTDFVDAAAVVLRDPPTRIGNG